MFLDPSTCVFVSPRTIGLILCGVSLPIDELVSFFPFTSDWYSTRDTYLNGTFQHSRFTYDECQRKELLFPLMLMSGDAVNYGVGANILV